METKDIDDFLLTKTVTVGEALEWIKEKNDSARDGLVNLIHHFSHNRYIKHLDEIDSGYLKMAISCLTIETLESFRQGIPDTSGKSKQMFIDFFSREDRLFHGFKDIASDFYKSIRCGILHQAETTNAWRILIEDNFNLLDKTNRTINATKFVNALKISLNNYIDELKTNDFNTPIWENAILKIENICENCKPLVNMTSD